MTDCYPGLQQALSPVSYMYDSCQRPSRANASSSKQKLAPAPGAQPNMWAVSGESRLHRRGVHRYEIWLDSRNSCSGKALQLRIATENLHTASRRRSVRLSFVAVDIGRPSFAWVVHRFSFQTKSSQMTYLVKFERPDYRLDHPSTRHTGVFTVSFMLLERLWSSLQPDTKGPLST